MLRVKQSIQKSSIILKRFSLLSEYNERKDKKLVGGALFTEEPKFWVTTSRPPNFGDHLDVRTKLDNWFDENR